MNPRASLRVAEEKTLWKADGKKLGARLARFAPDGDRLAWAVNGEDPGGGLAACRSAAQDPKMLWEAPAGGSVADLAWSSRGDLAACVRVVEGEKVRRFVVLSESGKKTARDLPGSDGAHCLAWRADGKTMALGTKTALLLYDLEKQTAARLLEIPAGKAPPKGPAFEDLVFYKNAVSARRAGTMGHVLRFPDGRGFDLGECRGLAPDPQRGRVYLVPWLAGPTKIPRGAGVAWIDPAAEKPARNVIVPDRPAEGGGKPYWLPDVWDWHYPTTLRVSPDGKSVTFLGVKAGVLAENPWREFCVWRAPADGSTPPEPLAAAGVIPKRIDIGRNYAIGWRYDIDGAVLFYDLAAGRAWRLPEKFYVQRGNTDADAGKLLVAGARGKDVVLFRLEPVKGEG